MKLALYRIVIYSSSLCAIYLLSLIFLSKYSRYAWEYKDLAFGVSAIWLFLCLMLELYSYFNKSERLSLFVSHLRNGPTVLSFVFILALLTTHFILVQKSKWEIRDLVYSTAPLERDPALHLFVGFGNYWCVLF